VGELSSERPPCSWTVKVGLKFAVEGGWILNLRLEDVMEVGGLGLFIGSRRRIDGLYGTRNLRGESSSGSSGTASTMLAGRGRLDMRTTLERLCPFRLEPLLLGLV
jgi:hypothetical protein